MVYNLRAYPIVQGGFNISSRLSITEHVYAHAGSSLNASENSSLRVHKSLEAN